MNSKDKRDLKIIVGSIIVIAAELYTIFNQPKNSDNSQGMYYRSPTTQVCYNSPYNCTSNHVAGQPLSQNLELSDKII